MIGEEKIDIGLEFGFRCAPEKVIAGKIIFVETGVGPEGLPALKRIENEPAIFINFAVRSGIEAGFPLRVIEDLCLKGNPLVFFMIGDAHRVMVG